MNYCNPYNLAESSLTQKINSKTCYFFVKLIYVYTYIDIYICTQLWIMSAQTDMPDTKLHVPHDS